MQKFSVGLGDQKSKPPFLLLGWGFEIIWNYLLLHSHKVHYKVVLITRTPNTNPLEVEKVLFQN
jgi:hypothetical protein